MEKTLVISILINIFLSGGLITLTIFEWKSARDNMRFLESIEKLLSLMLDLKKTELKEESNEPRQSDRT